jgi:uncharacterized protein
MLYVYILAGLVFILLVLYSFLYEPTNFKLTEINILVKDKNPDNSPAVDGSLTADSIKLDNPILTILHLSDFHLRKNFKGKKLFKFVRSLERIQPDFIFITGDLTGSSNVDYLIEMLSPLRAKEGKYAIFGVHDYYDKALVEFLKNMFIRKRRYNKENDVHYLIERLKDIGIEVLINEKRQFSFNNKGVKDVEIIGLDDPVIEKIDINKAFSNSFSEDAGPWLDEIENYRQIYKSVFRLNKDKIHSLHEKNKLRLVLLHTPDQDSIISLAKRKADIIFCGHTHGGQVRLPFIGAIISGCKIKTKFASGLFYFKDVVLFITRGLGEGRYTPFRFYCQPEANLVRIYKRCIF